MHAQRKPREILRKRSARMRRIVIPDDIRPREARPGAQRAPAGRGALRTAVSTWRRVGETERARSVEVQPVGAQSQAVGR